MKAFTLFIAIVLLGFAAHQFLPWWSICGVALLASALAGGRPAPSFLIGFLASTLLWGGMAGWLDHSGNGLLSERIGQLFGGIPVAALIAVTGLLGGLLGGLGALTGSLGRQLTR